jgi:hypothetical protein
MSNKMKGIFNVLILATISLLFLASASAALIDVNKGELTFTKSQNTALFDINAYDNVILQITNNLNATDDLGNSLVFKISNSNLNFPLVNTTTLNVSYTQGSFEFKTMDYAFGQITILAMNAFNHSINETHSINVGFTGSLCQFGKTGNNNISITDVTDDSDDEWVWTPLQEVIVSVDVENNNHAKSESIKVQPELYDENGKKINLNINAKSIKIDADDSDTLDFTFKVPADINGGYYRLYVKAYLSSGGESAVCDDEWSGSSYEFVEIQQDDRNVVIDSELLGKSMPFEVNCNQDVSLSIPVYNIGNEKEDSVKVILRNKELGISLEQVLENMHTGNTKNADFSFLMPENATANKLYNFDLLIYYDYDDNDGVYSTSNTYALKFKVISADGCKAKGDVAITAALDSQKVASGNEVKINVTLTNPGATATTYSVSVDGIDGWATLKSISPQTITLAPSEKKTVVITLQLDKSASGDQTFAIATSYNDQVKTQQVSMFVEKSSFFGNIFGESSWLANHWGLLLIILVNVALIVVIVVLAIKLSK